MAAIHSFLTRRTIRAVNIRHNSRNIRVILTVTPRRVTVQIAISGIRLIGYPVTGNNGPILRHLTYSTRHNYVGRKLWMQTHSLIGRTLHVKGHHRGITLLKARTFRHGRRAILTNVLHRGKRILTTTLPNFLTILIPITPTQISKRAITPGCLNGLGTIFGMHRTTLFVRQLTYTMLPEVSGVLKTRDAVPGPAIYDLFHRSLDLGMTHIIRHRVQLHAPRLGKLGTRALLHIGRMVRQPRSMISVRTHGLFTTRHQFKFERLVPPCFSQAQFIHPASSCRPRSHIHHSGQNQARPSQTHECQRTYRPRTCPTHLHTSSHAHPQRSGHTETQRTSTH